MKRQDHNKKKVTFWYPKGHLEESRYLCNTEKNSYLSIGDEWVGCFLSEHLEYICTDTDNGNDIYEKGTVLYNGVYYNDKCESTNTQIEYFCVDNNLIKYNNVTNFSDTL